MVPDDEAPAREPSSTGYPEGGDSASTSRYDWDDIAYFLELVRQGQLVGAARRLNVDHTTVSRRIRALEDALNCKLFSRTKAGFVLTEAGLRILEHAEAMEFRAHSISRMVGVEGAESGGTVRIATMEGIGSFYLGPRIQRFHHRHPSILVELVTAPHWINLSRREADIFISFPKPPERRLTTRKVGEFRVFLYASDDYLGRRGEPRTKDELDGHDFVDYIDDLIQIHAVRWLADIVLPRQVVFRSSSLIAQYASASSGLGIAALPTFVAAQNPALRPVLPHLTTRRDIWLSVHQDLEDVSRVSSAVRFLADQIVRDREFFLGEGHACATT